MAEWDSGGGDQVVVDPDGRVWGATSTGRDFLAGADTPDRIRARMVERMLLAGLGNASMEEFQVQRRELADQLELTSDEREAWFGVQPDEVTRVELRHLAVAGPRADAARAAGRFRVIRDRQRSLVRVAVQRRDQRRAAPLVRALGARRERDVTPRRRETHGSPRKARAPGDDDPPGEPSPDDDAVRSFLRAVTRWERGQA